MNQNDIDDLAVDAHHEHHAATTGGLTATAERVRLVRAPGILFLTAALLLPLSGVAAFDVEAPVLPPEPDVAAPAADPLPVEPDLAPTERDDPAPDTPARHPGLRTGDRVDEAERQAFLEWVAAQQADGKHRGVAVYASW